MPIDEAFFRDYAGTGQSYARVWRDHCYFDECCDLFTEGTAGLRRPRSICVLGAATGQICRAFHRRLGVKPYGCETSVWAHGRIPEEYRARIQLADMRDYVASVANAGRVFDLVFTNSLIYLPEQEILPFLRKLARCSRWVHFHSSFQGSACPDAWRQTLKSFKWWNEIFERAGLHQWPGHGRERTYLWSSSKV